MSLNNIVFSHSHPPLDCCAFRVFSAKRLLIVIHTELRSAPLSWYFIIKSQYIITNSLTYNIVEVRYGTPEVVPCICNRNCLLQPKCANNKNLIFDSIKCAVVEWQTDRQTDRTDRQAVRQRRENGGKMMKKNNIIILKRIELTQKEMPHTHSLTHSQESEQAQCIENLHLL